MSRLARAAIAVGLVVLAPRAPALAALAGAPHEDIHYVAEHVPEAFQDARFFALPWPGGGEPVGSWRGLLDVGWTSARTDLVDARGFLALVGGTYRRSEATALQVFGNAFVTFGLAFLHETSGLEFDLGSTAFFTVFEKITHAGISDALLVEIRWHPK